MLRREAISLVLARGSSGSRSYEAVLITARTAEVTTFEFLRASICLRCGIALDDDAIRAVSPFRAHHEGLAA